VAGVGGGYSCLHSPPGIETAIERRLIRKCDDEKKQLISPLLDKETTTPTQLIRKKALFSACY
jgi:hypothetical protein